MPDSNEKIGRFRSYLMGLNSWVGFRDAKLRLREDQISQVDSHDHALLQCLDIVLGSMQFRLNDKHMDKPPNSRKRAGKTIAKERLFKLISERVRGIYPRFNIGISTGIGDSITNRWQHPYRHWLFIPKEKRAGQGSADELAVDTIR